MIHTFMTTETMHKSQFTPIRAIEIILVSTITIYMLAYGIFYPYVVTTTYNLVTMWLLIVVFVLVTKSLGNPTVKDIEVEYIVTTHKGLVTITTPMIQHDDGKYSKYIVINKEYVEDITDDKESHLITVKCKPDIYHVGSWVMDAVRSSISITTTDVKINTEFCDHEKLLAELKECLIYKEDKKDE